jgi:YegS/Rv2252/BmrU family lipid kinase
MDILLIYNKFAGGKSATKHENRVISAFKNAGHECKILYTKPDKRSTKEIAEMDLSPFNAFIIAGGDGTIMEALNGYIPNKTINKPPIGFIPVGTGNAFVRDIGIKTDEIERAVELISQNKVKPVDAAFAKAGGDEFYFFNIMGIGFVSDVSNTAQKFKFLGNIAYTIAIFIEAMRLKKQKAKLIVDGNEFEFNYNFIEVSNTRYTSNFLMAPSAEFDDGLLDITVLEHVNLFRLISSFPKILDGSHISMPEIKTFKGKKISILSDKVKIATPDGELKGATPIEIEVIKHAFQIFY